METTMAWLPNSRTASRTSCGFASAAVLMTTFSTPALNILRISSTEPMPPP
jgi:hypothetical protein